MVQKKSKKEKVLQFLCHVVIMDEGDRNPLMELSSITIL